MVVAARRIVVAELAAEQEWMIVGFGGEGVVAVDVAAVAVVAVAAAAAGLVWQSA